MKTLTKEEQQKITPAEAINLLKNGNRRFLERKMEHRDYNAQIEITSNGQFPLACVLSCIDSRVPVELIFDQGLGDVFSCRVAGSVINEDVLGSMEFACKIAGAKAIVVLGHTRCGAIMGACDNVQMGNLTALLNKIKPAIDAETTITENRNSGNKEFLYRVTDLNIHRAIRTISEKSPLLAEMATNHQIAIIGGVYDVETGKVTFYDDTLSL